MTSVAASGWLEAVRRRVELLRALDPERRVAGARVHGYRFGPVLAPAELAALEAALGSPLPREYRELATTLGATGVGPYLGLVAAAAPEAEPAADGARPEPGRPFHWEVETAADAEVAPGAHLLDGTLTLAEHGDGGRSLLVVQGPRRGAVWADFTRAGGPLVPEADGFGAWVAAWVGRALIEWAGFALPAIALDGAEGPELEGLAAVRGPLERTAEGDADRLRTLGYLHLAERRIAEAEAAFDAALEAGGEEPLPRRVLDAARTAWVSGDHARALALAEGALAREGLFYATDDALRELVEHAHWAAGRDADAIAVLERRASERFFSLDLHHRLAWAHATHGDLAAAGAALERAAQMPNILGWGEPLARRVAAAFEPVVAALRAEGRGADAEALARRAADLAEG